MLDTDISDVTMCIINYQWETVVYFVVLWWGAGGRLRPFFFLQFNPKLWPNS